MAETFQELGICSSPTLDGFARFSGISRDKLRGAIDRGQVTAELEAELAAAGGFDPEDLTWKDTRIDFLTRSKSSNRYLGQDSALEFRRMHRLRHGRPVFGNLVLRSQRPVLMRPNLASLEVSSAQVGVEDKALPIIMSLILEKGTHESGLTYGFRKVRVRFEFAPKSGARFEKPLGNPTTNIGNGKLHNIGYSSSFSMYWEVYAEKGMLHGSFVTDEQPLAEVVDLTVDEEFIAELSVRPMDGDVFFQGAARPSLSPAQRAVLKSLMAEKLPGSADGWIRLGQQTLIVARA